jgi:CxxC motif-containing protein (DUF1111 family)
MFTHRPLAASLVIFATAFLAVLLSTNAQGQGGLGGPLPNLAPIEAMKFGSGQTLFFRLWGVKEGLGPLYTDGGCSRCHKSPVIGGGAQRLSTYFGLTNPDGTFDQFYLGGPFLQPLSLAPFVKGCTLPGEQVPAGATVEKRLVSPLFGFGLIDAVADTDILNQVTFEAVNYQSDGIHGMDNPVADYKGVIRPGRFGHKAQLPTLLQQVATNFAHDIGITNPLIPDEDCPQGNCDVPPACVGDPNEPNASQGELFTLTAFVRFLAPAQPTQTGLPGEAIFTSIGCIECHLPSYQTPLQVFYDIDLNGHQFGPSPSLSNQPVNLYSDLLLHDMGPQNAGTFPANTLITGGASPQMWRTAPLWGISVRTVFWHDGRSKDIPSAILQHSPDGTGEATVVLQRYKALSPSDQTLLIQFVQSL